MTAPPPLRPTRASLPIALLRAREKVMGQLREMLAQSGVNEQKWRVLRVLDEGGAMEMTALAQAACLLLPSLTRIARGMERDGLIARTPGTKDRRTAIVSITAAGQAVIAAHAASGDAILARMEARFGTARMAALLALLDDLQALNLRDQDGTAQTPADRNPR